MGTAEQVAQQAQHLAGLSAEAVVLLKLFFVVVFVVAAAVVTAVVWTKDSWLPVVRGLARDHSESDPKKGNGSLRDDFNKAIGSLQVAVTEIGGALVKTTVALHDRMDGIVHRFENFTPNRQYEDMLREIAVERAEARAQIGRELARSSTHEEREKFRQDHEPDGSGT